MTEEERTAHQPVGQHLRLRAAVRDARPRGRHAAGVRALREGAGGEDASSTTGSIMIHPNDVERWRAKLDQIEAAVAAGRRGPGDLARARRAAARPGRRGSGAGRRARRDSRDFAAFTAGCGCVVSTAWAVQGVQRVRADVAQPGGQQPARRSGRHRRAGARVPDAIVTGGGAASGSPRSSRVTRDLASKGQPAVGRIPYVLSVFWSTDRRSIRAGRSSGRARPTACTTSAGCRLGATPIATSALLEVSQDLLSGGPAPVRASAVVPDEAAALRRAQPALCRRCAPRPRSSWSASRPVRGYADDGRRGARGLAGRAAQGRAAAGHRRPAGGACASTTGPGPGEVEPPAADVVRPEGAPTAPTPTPRGRCPGGCPARASGCGPPSRGWRWASTAAGAEAARTTTTTSPHVMAARCPTATSSSRCCPHRSGDRLVPVGSYAGGEVFAGAWWSWADVPEGLALQATQLLAHARAPRARRRGAPRAPRTRARSDRSADAAERATCRPPLAEFKAERPYPNDKDEWHEEQRATFAEALVAENLTVFDLDLFR